MGVKFGRAIASVLVMVTKFIVKLVECGIKIPMMIAKGILSGVGKVTEAIKKVTQSIRDHLPHIPTSQSPIEFKEAQVVANIAARDNLEVFSGLHALVVDATADSTVETGGAEYIYDGTKWIKVSELNDLDAVITWDNVLNKPYFVQTLLDLSDTPDSLKNCAGKVLGVNSTEDGFTFLSVYTGDVDGGGF